MDYELEKHNIPDHGTVYFKAHNSTLKGHFRGLTRGLVTGLVFGTLVGVAFFALAPLTLPAAIAASIGPSVIAAFASLGAIMGGELMGHIGTSSGTVSANLAEKELQLRYPSLPVVSADSPEPGVGYHSEIPPDRDKGKFFHWKTGIAGAALGATVGWLFGVGGLAEHLLGNELMHTVTKAIPFGTTAISTAAAGLFGAQFGVNRGVFKSIFNYTDNMFQGRVGGPSQEQIMESRKRYREEHPSIPSEISSLQRQEEFYRLQNGYFKEAFKAGFVGNARGLLAGMVAGALTGLVLGGALALGLGALAIVSPAIIATITTLSVAIGASIGSHTFAKNTSEPALHAAADEIFEERIKALKEGKDIGFAEADKLASIRRKADPNFDSPESEVDESWINPKIMLMGAAVGSILGIVMFPIFGTAMAHVLGVKTLTIAASSTILGSMGSLFGLGGKVRETLGNVADYIYLGTLTPETQPDIRTTTAPPLLESNSPLQAHGISHAKSNNAKVSEPAHHVTDSFRQDNNRQENKSPEQTQAFLKEILQRKQENIITRKAQAMENYQQRVRQQGAETASQASVAIS